ncbi:MAG TPA: imidazole glycerol phosphate synthase subunit HisH [Gemmataceae bacterium]|jgi:glutamine amidotransferase
MVGIIDYGMGNLRSVWNAFRFIGTEPIIVSNPAELEKAHAVVLPGVGAFGDGMSHLRERGWVDALETHVREKRKPFLGICLGMQLLATTGLEHGVNTGLNWVQGVVERIPAAPDNRAIRVPHVGWNEVRCSKRDGLYAGLGDSKAFYFVHSYHLKPSDPTIISGMCDHGIALAASIELDNVWATQFHPEKSHQAGLTVLRNFARRR